LSGFAKPKARISVQKSPGTPWWSWSVRLPNGTGIASARDTEALAVAAALETCAEHGYAESEVERVV
jgi:hypothetical protein